MNDDKVLKMFSITGDILSSYYKILKYRQEGKGTDVLEFILKEQTKEFDKLLDRK